jgi:preprotein translocase subunit SecG
MTAFFVVLHVTVMILMVASILAHSGRGGGLSDLFGGGQSLAAGSTAVEKNLNRITLIFAVTFVFTTMILALRLQP